MSDFELTRDGELEVAHIEALTDAGVEFVDAWNPLEMTVVDSGRILLPYAGLDAFLEVAREHGLTAKDADA